MIAELLKLIRRISRVLALVWAIPVGLLMLWTYAVLNHGVPLWQHPAFLDWLKIELTLVATFVAATALATPKNLSKSSTRPRSATPSPTASDEQAQQRTSA